MEFRGTTICAVKKNGVTAIAGDGQVTMGESVIFKNTAIKVRRIFGGKVILGFAGSVTDAFALTERFEGMLNKFGGNLMRSAVELADLWRSDKLGRKLDAMMITADENNLLILSGTGEVIEPDEGVCAIGSGGNYALALTSTVPAKPLRSTTSPADIPVASRTILPEPVILGVLITLLASMLSTPLCVILIAVNTSS